MNQEEWDEEADDAMDCVQACTQCAQVCHQMALNHCLEMGGEHVSPPHLRLMLDCAEVCQLAAKLQLGSSEFAEEFCALCAEVCLACAESCDTLPGMEDCASTCRRCAFSCEVFSDQAS